MGEEVSAEQNTYENPTKPDVYIDLKHEFNIHYRLLRKRWSAFIRKQLQKNFANILYITIEKPSFEFILSLQRQYPDKVIKLLVPLLGEVKDFEKTSINFDYFLQNQKFTASVYKIPSEQDNLQIFGISTNAFDELNDYLDIYNLKYLVHFVKLARKAALKIKPDIIHADNIPLLAGIEFGKRWSSGYPIRYVQTVHDLYVYENIEPFWAAINLVNKKEMSKICSDGTIKKSIAELFNMQDTKKFTKLRECLDYLYKNYEFFRNNIDKKENIKENVLIDQLNQRIIKMFPTCVQKNSTMYNPMYYSMKKASHRVVNSLSKKIPQDFSSFKDFVYIVKKYDDNKYDKIRHQFDVSNFREKRFLNKIYLVKEFSEKRIETKFVDPNLFASDEVNIYGYLDSFYRNTPLFMVYFNKFTKEEDIKKASIALLNIIEQRKNIQIIYNFPQNYNSQYIKSLIEFFESQSLLKGKWVAIEGEINLPQFLSSADMILIPSDKNLQLENTVYTALKYGCIPVISSDGVCDDIVIDIFDDMNSGCGFKVEKSDNDTNEDAVEYERALYTENLERALNFYENSAASWNILIKNAINCDRSWDFSTIESYNNVYDDII